LRRDGGTLRASAMSEFCNGKKHLSETTTILPAGGSRKKMLPLAAMAVAEKTQAVVLVDDDSAGEDTVKLLEQTLRAHSMH